MNHKNIGKTVAILLCLMPILDPYIITTLGSNEIHVMDFLCFIMTVHIFIFHKKIRVVKPLILFLLLLFLLNLTSFMFCSFYGRDMGISLRVWSIWLFYTLIFGGTITKADHIIFRKYVNYAGIIVSLFLYIQYVFSHLGFVVWDGRIPFLALSKYDGWSQLLDITGVIRCHSFFQEPSYFSLYMLPIIADAVQQKKFKLVIFYSFAVILTTSSIGIIGIALIFIVNTITYLSKRKLSKKQIIEIYLCTMVVLIGALLIYLASPSIRNILSYSLDKFMKMNTDLSSDRMGSTRLRIIGNLPQFFTYSSGAKIVGVGIYQYTLVDQSLIPYSNTMVTLLLNNGVIGALAFLGIFIKRLINTNKEQNIFILLFLLTMFTDHVLFNWYFFYLLYWVLSTQDSNQKKV